MPSTSAAGVPALAAPSHERRMEAAPHGAIDDGFGGTITDVADFGREFCSVLNFCQARAHQA